MSVQSHDGHHDHVFLGAAHERNERRTMMVVAITAATMVIEIVAGAAFGSMALLADGFHMSTHAGALLVAALAYRYARRHQDDPAFTFGTGKVGDLAAFASALVLGMIALLIIADSVWRFGNPVTIQFDQALVIAVIGLAVNLASAGLLHEGHHAHEDHGHDDHGHDDHGHDDHGHDHHDHGHDDDHDHDHAHHDHRHDHGHKAHGDDHNLRAAYIHVIADAVTSVLAIGALVAGRVLHWVWLDPAAGILGACVIISWSITLIRQSGAVLLDAVPDQGLAAAVRTRIEQHGDHIADLHLWRVGPGHNAAVISIVADTPQSPDHYKAELADLEGLSHVTVEVQRRRAA